MYQKDYILRLIEEFGRFLRLILNLKSEKQYDEVTKVINETALKLLEVDLRNIETDDRVSEEILKNPSLNADQLNIIAELVKIKAEIYQEKGEIFTAISLFGKSLILFERSESKSNTYSLERIEKMREINLQLDHLRDLP